MSGELGWGRRGGHRKTCAFVGDKGARELGVFGAQSGQDGRANVRDEMRYERARMRSLVIVGKVCALFAWRRETGRRED